MGPPPNSWLNCHVANTGRRIEDDYERHNVNIGAVVFRSIKIVSINFTVAVILVLSVSVYGGPVLHSPYQIQGAVTLARNIRHLPCISRKTGQEGVCMFAIDCLKANGSHLGTCIDRFYFGSCCQITDKTLVPHIEDNTIDDSNFVHPHKDDFHNNGIIPEVFPTKKPSHQENLTKKPESLTTKLEKPSVESKTETTITTAESKIDDIDDKVTNAMSSESTTKVQVTTTTGKPEIINITEIPIKLSTFQTVSDEQQKQTTAKSNITSTQETTTEVIKATQKPTTSPTTITSATYKPRPTGYKPPPPRKPVRTTPKPIKPRPTLKPFNITSTQQPKPVNATIRPKPIKPVASLNITRLPPYRPPTRKPISTKKPIPIPPRLNITILPQLTNARPTPEIKPESSTITYISPTTENATKVEPTSTTTTTSSTTVPTTLSSTTESTTSSSTTTTTTTTTSVAPPISSSTEPSTTEQLIISLKPLVTTSSIPPTEIYTEKENIANITEKPSTTVELPVLTEAETAKPISTEFPPGLVTWSNTVDATTRQPDANVTASDEIISPITPLEDWVLVSTVPPKPETTAAASSTTSEPSSPIPTTTELSSTEESTSTTFLSSSSSSSSSSETPSSSTAESLETTVEMTEATVLEFTVNVTLSPQTTESTTAVVVTSLTENFTETAETVTDGNVTVSTESLNTTAVTSSSNVTEKIPTATGTSVSESTTPSTVTSTTESVNMTNYKDVCGRRLWPEARIVGGAKSAFGRWPWQISLRQWRTSTYLHKCGAALLNENWAITAAHCVEHVPPSELLVRLGEHDLANEDEPYGFAERRVQIVASHPHFDPATFEYDLALLRFYEPVTFQPNIIPICVPDNDEDFVGKTAFVTGWGRLYDEGPLPSVLQEVSVPVINNTACEAMYQAAGYNEHIPNIFICAGWRKGGSDSCEGDSGGPMVLQRERDKRFVLGGVISWGIGCAEPNQPGVYTRISEFRDWINQILQF